MHQFWGVRVSRPVERARFRALLLLAVLAACDASRAELLAQRPTGTLRGVVTDSRSLPVSGVRVVVGPNGIEATSDSLGRFVVSGLPLGVHPLSIRRIGFAPLFADIDLRRAGETVANITLEPLTAAISLDTVRIVANGAVSPELEGFYERRATGIGQFIMRETLDQRSGSTLSEVLRSRATRLKYVPRACSNGVAIVGADSPVDLMPSQKVGQGMCTMTGACYAQVFVDGVRLYSYDRFTLPPNIDELQTKQVEAIEIYHGGAETPARFGGTGAACGTIVVWLRR
jgi:Carboxypeptidase regulatory-like domain